MTFTHPNRNYLIACGSIVNVLVGGDTTYVALANDLLTVYTTLETDV